jgi:hypothetical protein
VETEEMEDNSAAGEELLLDDIAISIIFVRMRRIHYDNMLLKNCVVGGSVIRRGCPGFVEPDFPNFPARSLFSLH